MKVAYFVGCVLLAMTTLFSMVYAQGTCPTPGMPANLSPSDGATNISVNPILSWSASSNTDSYNVYFGTSSNPPYLGNTANVNYALTNLVSNTTYLWRISALNNCGNATVGPVWSFKTGCPPPETPSNPGPKNGAMVVTGTVSLSWTSSYADSYDVYFGTSSNPPFLSNTPTGSYNVSDLTPNNMYYWKVVALSNCGYSASGPVWSFTTAPTNPYSSSNWINIEPPDVSSNWSLNSVYFASSNEGWAVGVDNQNNRGVLLNYFNGSWTSINPPDFSPSWELNAVYFTSPEEGWAVGTEHITPINRGVLLHYSNGSWTSITPPNVSSDWELYGVHFTSANEGWAVGDDYGGAARKGVLLHYLNGSWTFINPPDEVYCLNSVHFTSPDEGWAVGYRLRPISENVPGSDGIFLHYLNGSWENGRPYNSRKAIPPYPMALSNESLNHVHFISPNEGWAVGSRSATSMGTQGVLSHYLNGSWEGGSGNLNYSSSNWELNSVHFTSPNEGWTVGESYGKGVLLQYWYGYWEPVSPSNVSSSWALNSIHFTSPDEGWAVGTDYANAKGVLLRFSAPSEVISTPTTPSGPTSGITNNSYSYSTGGSTSNFGHTVEYQFDWKGDGSDRSPWGSSTQSKTWTALGTYNVRARARCTTDTSVVSEWSTGLTVTIYGISVVSPNGGENWKAGTTQTISWSYTGNLGKYVKIELLKGESVNRTIAYRTSIGSGGSGSYSWRMFRFQTPGSDYKIRITSFSNSSYTDTSDNNFTISK